MHWTKNQRTILINSSWWASYENLTTMFLTAFILALGANNLWVGIISAIPYLAVLLAQIPGALSTQYIPRKTIYMVTTGVSRLFWILILVSPALFREKALIFISLGFFVCKLFEFLADNAWTTMLADVVPLQIRGAFVGHRMVLMGITSTVTYLAGGLVLDMFPKGDISGFLLLFLAGTAIGLFTTYSYRSFDEPKAHQHEEYTVKEFFTMKGTFARFCLFVFYFYFAIMIVSPFFTVYMLKDLGISYTFFVVVTGLSTIAKILSQDYIGRISDKVGDKFIMMCACVLTAIVPFIFYFIGPTNLWLIIPAQIFSGLAWAGFDIVILNMMLDYSEGEKQPVRLAEMQMVSSIAIIIGPLIGGYLADNVSMAFFRGIPMLFLIGAILRISSLIFLIPLPELRVKKAARVSDVFRDMIVSHPLEGACHVTRNIRRRLKAFMLT